MSGGPSGILGHSDRTIFYLHCERDAPREAILAAQRYAFQLSSAGKQALFQERHHLRVFPTLQKITHTQSGKFFD
jgi:hypothetical protein